MSLDHVAVPSVQYKPEIYSGWAILQELEAFYSRRELSLRTGINVTDTTRAYPASLSQASGSVSEWKFRHTRLGKTPI